MMLRAAIVFLLVLNIGIAAWWIGGGNAVGERPRAPLPADAPSLRLVGETATATAPTTAAPAASVTPPAVAAIAPDAAPPETQPPEKPVAIEQCLRFGPFTDAAARDAARSALAAAGVSALPRETPARSGRGWQVHIPALASREEAHAMGERIKAAGIKDWYVMNEGAAANSIAMGRYGGEEAARRREAELKAKGIPAMAEALGDSAPQSWLDARLKEGANRVALASVAPSKAIECATLR